ncbi:hypothetical protein [Achromobacter sp. UMC46]|uniref:hypothetical protein n=1 Tax=Achromobacter sp. UMC46 TaxID=1862319 RepID=UPI001601FDBD|nr:hypothetical protein [Achromobacter sp. UMC46]
MQKTNKADQADKAQDLQVQPLTAEEIGQVSGGGGQSRMLMPVLQRTDSFSRGSASLSGKGLHFAK